MTSPLSRYASHLVRAVAPLAIRSLDDDAIDESSIVMNTVHVVAKRAMRSLDPSVVHAPGRMHPERRDLVVIEN